MTLHTEKLHGEVGRGITVRSNDPERPNLFLTVKANVTASLTILPYELLRSSNRGTADPVARVLVHPEKPDEGPLAVDGLGSTLPWLDLRVRRVESPEPGGAGLPPRAAGDWVIEAEPRADAPNGRHQGTVTFRTGIASQPVVTLPVTVDREAPFSTSADSVRIGPRQADGSWPEATILLSLRRGLDRSSLTVATEPSTLHARLEPAGPGGFRLLVGWAGDGDPHGTVDLELQGERLRLPVVSAAPGS